LTQIRKLIVPPRQKMKKSLELEQRFAISYLRFSHKRQAKGDTVRRQMKACDDYVRRHNLTLLESFADKGVSGFRGMHATKGALGALLDKIETGALPDDFILIIENIDRLSREPTYDALERFTKLISRGVSIVCLDLDKLLNRETINKDPSLLNTVVMMMQRGRNESETKSTRVRESYDARFEKAREDGLAIKGYRGPAWLKVQHRRYVEHPARCDVVREIYRLRIDGLGDYAIAQTLNQRQVPVFEHCAKRKAASENTGWYPAYVGKILASRAVLGEFDPRGEGRPFDYFPKIVSPAVWADAQDQKRTRNTAVYGARGTKHHNLFMGLTHCVHCGATMTMTQNRPDTDDRPAIRYLVCSNKRRHAAMCAAVGMVNYRRIETAILGHLPSIPWTEIVRAENPDDPLKELDEKIAATRDELAGYKDQNATYLELVHVAGANIQAVADAMVETQRKAEIAEAILKNQQNERRTKAALTRPGLIKDALSFVEAMEKAPERDRYEARARLSKALAKIITRIDCDGTSKHVRVRVSQSYDLMLRTDVENLEVYGQYAQLPLKEGAKPGAPHKAAYIAKLVPLHLPEPVFLESFVS